MTQICKANPCCGDPAFCSGVPLPQFPSGLVHLNKTHAADVPTHRHKKRGTEYVLIGYGKIQSEKWAATARLSSGNGGMPIVVTTPVDMREVAIYQSVDDGSLWVRPREEFEDGRFEALP